MTSKRTAFIQSGMVTPGPLAPFGFTDDLFEGSWLWVKEGSVYVSFIQCKKPGQGYFRKLIEAIISAGFIVKIPTALGKMKEIVTKNGYEKTLEFDKHYGADVEIWVKRPL